MKFRIPGFFNPPPNVKLPSRPFFRWLFFLSLSALVSGFFVAGLFATLRLHCRVY